MNSSNAPLKICFIAPGRSIHTRRWVEGIAGRGHQVLLITVEPPASAFAETFDPYENIGVWANVPKVRVLFAERAIRRRIRDFRPDVVHMHWLLAHTLYLRIAKSCDNFMVSVWGKDVIWDGPDAEPPGRRRLKRNILAAAREVTATTQFLADRTAPLLATGRTATVVRWGVDTHRFTPGPPPPAGAPRVIGFLKHYLPKYGPDTFIQAIPIIRERAADLRFEMYGAQPFDDYAALSHEIGVDDVLTFNGGLHYDRVPDAFRRFYLYVMPSRYESETFGVSAVEAAACGAPVVASRVGGVPEALDDNVTGLLVPPGEPAALADAIVALAQDVDRRNRMSAAGVKFVQERYRWAASLEHMESIYRRIADIG